jgi:hypothetical protein
MPDLDEARILIALPDAPAAPTLRDVLAHQADLLAARAGGGGAVDRAAIEGVLAREHYLGTWDRAMGEGDRVVDRRFEAAADAIVAGDLAALRRLVDEDPALVTARSAYGHRSTLLNHVAGNGIEWARQWQTPANIVAITELLLAAGAEPDATSDSYGSPSTTLTLVVSSTHPSEAGLQGDLVEALVRGGAKVDGPDDDGGPLWSAITWGYVAAVDRLAACGARIDNLVFAAAVDDVERVEQLVAAPPRARSGERIAGGGPVLDPEHMLEYATIYAASLDRRRAVEALLAHGPDLAFREPLYQATAIECARYRHPGAGRPHGNPEMVALLERWLFDQGRQT